MPSTLTETLRARLFNSAEHPYRILERRVGELLRPDHTLLDAGCGRSMELVHRFSGKVRLAIGVDLCDFRQVADDGHCRYLQCDLSAIQLESESVDVVLSRSVMEHLENPDLVYGELHRLLKPGGYLVFLTPNLWDYASIISRLIPNRFHPFIVAKTEGRKESDTFPTCYRANTSSAIRRRASSFHRANGHQP